MYYSFVSQKACFTRQIQEQKSFRESGKLTLILPLPNKQVILFYDDCWCYHIKISNNKVLHQEKLPGRVLDAIVLGQERIILLNHQTRSIMEFHLLQKKLKELYKITNDLVFYTKKQVSQTFLSSLHAFQLSQTFYIQRNFPDERKIKIVYFPKERQFQVRQFEARNYIYQKLDETTSIVRYRQNPQQNSCFAFEEIDLQRHEPCQYKIECVSFVQYSTIIEVKKYKLSKYLICLNAKNGQHEILIYNKIQKSIMTLCISEKIMSNCVYLNENMNFGVFKYYYGQAQNEEIVKMINLENGKTIDKIQMKIDKLAGTSQLDYLVQYSKEVQAKPITTFNLIGLISKRSLYIKMLENKNVDKIFGNQFLSKIVQMME